MKAMILAAGRGERLRPLTDATPKPLIQAGPKRLIEYLIEALVRAGISELVINHAHLGAQFPSTLGNGSRYGAKISYSAEGKGLETAGGIINALPLLGNEPFLVVNGDIWTDFPFASLVERGLQDKERCHLVLVDNPEHNPQGDFGLSAGQVVANKETKYTFSGIALYDPALFHGLTVEKRPLKPLLLQEIDHQRASGELYLGQWSDIGTVERLNALAQQLTD